VTPPDVRRQIEALRDRPEAPPEHEPACGYLCGWVAGVRAALALLQAHDEQARRDRADDFAERTVFDL